MADTAPQAGSTRLSGEDLAFWWVDPARQPTTMAMLMLLDRRPDPKLLRAAFERAIAAVPRLREHVVEAPLGLTLPHWQSDPDFDLDYHVRHHALGGNHSVEELFREISPAYDTPFDRSRPLWEARIYEGLRGHARAALFFKLHHAVADGVGGNAVFAGMTDAARDEFVPIHGNGSAAVCAEEPGYGQRLAEAFRDGVALGTERLRSVTGALADLALHPGKLAAAPAVLASLLETARFDSHLPQRHYGRTSSLAGCALPFDAIRDLRRQLGGSVIDVILTIMAQAMRHWHATQGIGGVRELMTLVPVNLRKPEEWAEKPHVGNVATGILMPLPLWHTDPLAAFREVHDRVEAKKADPVTSSAPLLADVMSALPRPLFTLMATMSQIDFIVTNVPGILVPRYLAGAEILAAYPFAPTAHHSPVSVALYSYCHHLYIGLTCDSVTLPEPEVFKDAIARSFRELRDATRQRKARRRGTRRAAPAHAANGTSGG